MTCHSLSFLHITLLKYFILGKKFRCTPKQQ